VGNLQQFTVHFEINDPVAGIHIEIPAFTCLHCNRIIAPNVVSTADPTEINRKIQQWKVDTAVCRKCDANVCRLCALVDGECNTILRDAENAGSDKYKQPWLLRDQGEPVYRILDKDGEPILAHRKDVGYTDRQLEAIGGLLNYDGSRRTE